ncbi:3-oxoadipate enol-lactonase [Prosthecochloris sp. GSB1]|uniref:alpha/beta fold hydrolase n=1 Tax=Prosthecochloris sp. GSB1 TaxID=281093 RepID=UPI000B8CC150|nr:3-oxoadipate enol-lactonase [Prosthecochloris sp. GSB1]
MKNVMAAIILCLSVLAGCADNAVFKHDIAISSDSERIAYNVYGSGSTALIFVHGWSCDGRYWKNQIPEFSKEYKVITVDLAGHGHSSLNRADYTTESFAGDIKAVVEKENIDRAVLIGHSMGGDIAAESARLLPQTIISIIGVDTFHNVDEQVTQEFVDQMIAPFNDDFVAAVQGFVSAMFPAEANKALVYWVREDMSSAPKSIALNAFRDYLERLVNGESAEKFKNIHVPVISINARFWPTDLEANRKHIKDYKLFYIEGTGHFPMMEKPGDFNRLLKEALEYTEARIKKNS